MTARRASLDLDTDFDDPTIFASVRTGARRGLIEDADIIDESPVTVFAARRAIAAPISFEPDEELSSTRPLPKITSASPKSTGKSPRLRRGLFGVATVAAASAVLIVPTAASTATAQSALSTGTIASSSTGSSDLVIPLTQAAAEERASQASRGAEDERSSVIDLAAQAKAAAEAEAARIAAEEAAAAEQAAADEAAQAAQPQGQPSTATGTGVTGGSCAFDGSRLGLTSNAYATFQAVCAQFPNVTSYGGQRPSADDHGEGRAVDIMISGPDGWQIANWLVANAGTLNVEYVIYEQSMWGSWAPGAGFVGMEDRGSVTQNHYDHVHVTVL
ncbi:hypothetical protein [Propionimicrobium sp. PCR01-08-3]|uniref:hypothetical protein n=1 Tax=Propionimicrobium sp. PCR01-08-3 TaxID=3052086 RepID=UPI00255D10FC|nr:hypothetical protein [Propionimicrobium sp. PCR01-08-3]WIY82794.1 hypothetical protein QQ658_00045 [Propionimicrobium sp. PCR01-08-3]